MAPVAGIFSLAMVLSDGLFKNQSKDSMEKVLQPKVMALRNLDLISREFCPYLEYFVAFSSVTSGRGNVGQTNYGYANSYMERLCEVRRSEGLPALAIQWGAVADVGSLAEKFDNKVSAGTVPQRIHSTLSLMNHFLRCNELVVSSLLRFEPKVDEKDLKRDIQSVISNVLGMI
jgi:fatty acid synthase